MTVVSIMQPAYLPWLGFFDRASKSDTFIVLDHVEMDRNSKTGFANRNSIKTPNGALKLTVPVKARGEHRNTPLNKLQISEPMWAKKHIKSIEIAYGKAPYFKDYAPRLFEILSTENTFLMDYTEPLRGFFFELLNINPKIVYSSQMNAQSRKADLIVELCQMSNARTYISGPFGRDYLDVRAFERADIQLEFHDYEHPTYAQMGNEFQPFMSILDLLFCEGPKALAILQNKSN